MSLTYSQFVYGFEVFSSGSTQNNLLDFNRGGVKQATLNAGVYTAKEFADEVARALNAADYSSAWTCTFDFATLKFTVAANTSFTLLAGSGTAHTTAPFGLLGFDNSDQASSSNAAIADQPVGTAPTGATAPFSGLWTAAEPNSDTTPVTAQADGTGALLTQRDIKATQNISDGNKVETTYVSTSKYVQIGFKALTASEQTKMESFLDWIERGKRFNWQPDKTATAALRLVLADPKEIRNQFTWMTRAEADYGVLRFLESLSRT